MGLPSLCVTVLFRSKKLGFDKTFVNSNYWRACNEEKTACQLVLQRHAGQNIGEQKILQSYQSSVYWEKPTFAKNGKETYFRQTSNWMSILQCATCSLNPNFLAYVFAVVFQCCARLVFKTLSDFVFPYFAMSSRCIWSVFSASLVNLIFLASLLIADFLGFCSFLYFIFVMRTFRVHL